MFSDRLIIGWFSNMVCRGKFIVLLSMIANSVEDKCVLTQKFSMGCSTQHHTTTCNYVLKAICAISQSY